MAYGGKMYEDKYNITSDTFAFLKRALLSKDFKEAEDLPVRGPSLYEENDWKYTFEFEGDMKCFNGREKIFYKDEEVFYQDVLGGLVIDHLG